MSEYRDFSSMPPEQEAKFIVYEARSVESQKAAVRMAAIVCSVMTLLLLAVVLGVDPGKSTKEKMQDHAEQAEDAVETKKPAASSDSEADSDKAKAEGDSEAKAEGDKAEGDSEAKAEGDSEAKADKAEGDKAEGDKAEGDGEAKADDKAKGDDKK